jgi:hypothetical protein
MQRRCPALPSRLEPVERRMPAVDAAAKPKRKRDHHDKPKASISHSPSIWRAAH